MHYYIYNNINIIIIVLDKLESNNEMSQASDEKDGWIDAQEEEEEAKWSKLRQERDKFLEERMVYYIYIIT